MFKMEYAVIHVEDFHKSYGNTHAVQGLTFQVNAGEIFGLVGPNGAGKTTTLRSLCGILTSTQGFIKVAGFDINKQPTAAKRHLAYIPDDPKLFDALTIWEHLEFIASVYDLRDYQSRAETLLEIFELTNKRNTIAQELSRGMRQKVAICCGYLHEPKVLLFDEPMTGLDPRGIRTAKDSIKQCAENGAAIMVSSHQLSLIENICTHLLIMDHGTMLFQGSMAEARQRFGDVTDDASLESIFFKATEGNLV
jgi:ABC-2 type transport system ATP-binding protein